MATMGRNPVQATKQRQRLGPTASGQHYLVQQPERLSALIDDAVRRRFDSNRNAAAKAVGIPYSTLKRLCEGRAPSIRHDTVQRLSRLLGRGWIKSLEAALLSPGAQRFLDGYDRWLEAERHALVAATEVPRLYAEEDGLRRQALAGQILDAESRAWDFVAHLKRRYPSYWRPLEKALEGKHRAARARLAEIRVIGPLLQHNASHWIERDWSDLTKDELLAFIKAGVTREVILLNREMDIVRAQREDQEWESVRKQIGERESLTDLNSVVREYARAFKRRVRS